MEAFKKERNNSLCCHCPTFEHIAASGGYLWEEHMHGFNICDLARPLMVSSIGRNVI